MAESIQEEQNPYEVLGVSPKTTDAEIKQAYRKAARANHPDLNPNVEGVTKQMQKINEAYEKIKRERAADFVNRNAESVVYEQATKEAQRNEADANRENGAETSQNEYRRSAPNQMPEPIKFRYGDINFLNWSSDLAKGDLSDLQNQNPEDFVVEVICSIQVLNYLRNRLGQNNLNPTAFELMSSIEWQLFRKLNEIQKDPFYLPTFQALANSWVQIQHLNGSKAEKPSSQAA